MGGGPPAHVVMKIKESQKERKERERKQSKVPESGAWTDPP